MTVPRPDTSPYALLSLADRLADDCDMCPSVQETCAVLRALATPARAPLSSEEREAAQAMSLELDHVRGVVGVGMMRDEIRCNTAAGHAVAVALTRCDEARLAWDRTQSTPPVPVSPPPAEARTVDAAARAQIVVLQYAIQDLITRVCDEYPNEAKAIRASLDEDLARALSAPEQWTETTATPADGEGAGGGR